MRIRKIGVVGTGLMGTGIAAHLARQDLDVMLLKWTKGSVLHAKEAFLASLEKDVKRGKATAEDLGKIGAIRWTDKAEDLAGCDLVIESIAEGKRVKRDCFRALDAIVKPEAVFASNTSTLKIGSLAQATKRQSKFFGLHFFNPVARMQLVEVATWSASDPEASAAVLDFVRGIGKTPVVVHSAPGFVVNRLLVAAMLEAIRMAFYEKPRVADIAGIDTCMKLGANHPMGPFELMDLIGVDVIEFMTANLYKGLQREHFSPPVLLEHMVEANFLGRKSGIGFYDYADRAGPRVNPQLEELARDPAE